MAERTAFVLWAFAWQPGHNDNLKLSTDLPGLR